MRNKLILASLAIFISFSCFSQDQTNESDINATEANFYAQKPDNTNKIEIYPNPTVDHIIVKINNSTLQNAAIEVHSIIGNEIRVETEKIEDGKFKIPTKSLAKGYYFVVIKDDSSKFKKAYRILKK